MVLHGPNSKFGNFDLVTKVKLDYADIQVSKWRSRITGLNVVHLDYNGTTIAIIMRRRYCNKGEDIDA